MYECIYGGTPFVCETRDETKKRIVRHRKTLKFPLMPTYLEPSLEALDLMMHLLVEKEIRLCTRRYQLNDWTRKMFGKTSQLNEADKQHCNYAGNFVYADDAEDIKNHAFFRGMKWDSLHKQTPYFIPQFRRPDSVRYFDQSDPISDIDSLSSDSGTGPRLQKQEENTKSSVRVANPPDEPKKSNQQESQHIVPSLALPVPNAQAARIVNEGEKAPGLQIRFQEVDAAQIDCTTTTDDTLHNLTLDITKAHEVPKNAGKSGNANPDAAKPSKRARDKILRDPTWASISLQMRKAGSFLGYEYQRGAKVNEVIAKAIETSREEASNSSILRRFSVREGRTNTSISEAGKF